ncbi:MAG TPA: HAMP domain-containing protein [Rhodocyclaceae bacterium]|nr:HAMP domain-containing protein [Rhodocyclaceae bacterium]
MGFISKSIVRVFNSVVFVCLVLGLAAFTVVIGWYNYTTTMAELTNKAKNTIDLAALSLKEPLWNYDSNTIQDIFSAILLDPDFVAIRVSMVKEKKVVAEKKRDNIATLKFEELQSNPMYIGNLAKISRENEVIAEVEIVTSTQKVREAIRNTALLISAFTLAFIAVISSVIWILGGRIVQRPINALRESADHLAGGNLNEVIDTSRKDELGSLAVSFDRMRNAIRKKLDDLSILNSTGEKLAGIHKQVEALETAIKVMSEQTRVERGSIYLLDRDKNLTLNAFYPKLDDPKVSHFPKSFRLDEGIAGQVASTGKVAFVPDVTQVPGYVGLSGKDKKDNPHALLCVPMMDDKDVFGVMNFIGDVGKVTFSPEDEGFALTIARMTVITIKNIQMLEVIEQHNRTLEEKILERTAELRQKTNDVNNMLQNMRQGIFTIVTGGVIHHEYSTFLADIFETREVALKPALSFLFANSSVGADELSQMDASLGSMVGEDAVMFEFNSHLLSTEYSKTFPDGRTKILALDWNPVLDADNLIDKVMVTVRDVTELKILQMETEKQKVELDIIGQILAISQKKFVEFIETSHEFIEENKSLIEKASGVDRDIVAVLFRNMHTIKGNARTYGLTHITDQVHAAETTYSRIRSGEDTEWQPELLLEELQATRVCIDRYDNVFKQKLAGFSSGDGEFLDRAIIDRITRAVEVVNDLSQVNELRNSFRMIKSSISTIGTESIDDVLKGIVNGVPSMARELNKELPDIVIKDNSIRLKKEVVPLLRNVFMHAFRNSMDHGLESTEQRIAKGKTPQGHIFLEISLDPDEMTFTFNDDGKGLALDRIYRKALETGQLSAGQAVGDEQIAQFIFHSGLSTADVVTSVSGRGVGMDAIKKFLRKQNGDIRIVFTGERTADGFRPFQQVITLPAKHAVQQL